jgi:hypothetical protein
MRTRSTLLLLLVVLGLGAFIYFYERHTESTLEQRNPGPFVGLQEADYDAVEIKSPVGKFLFKHAESGKRWVMSEPFDDFPDAEAMTQLHWFLREATVGEVLSEKHDSEEKLKEFSLNAETAIQVNVRKAGQIIRRVRLGKAGGLGETIYALDMDAPVAAVTLVFAKKEVKDRHIRDILAQPSEAFRLRDLLPFKANNVTQLALQRTDAQAGELEVVRKVLENEQATPWIISKPLKCRGEQKVIDDLIGAFCGSAPTLLSPESTPTETGNAVAKVTLFENGDPKGHVLEFYPAKAEETTSLVHAPRRKAWLRLDKAFLEAAKTSVNDLRSGKLGHFLEKEITTVEVMEPNKPSSKLYRVDGKWFLQNGPTEFVRGSEETIRKTIENINNAEIGEFVTDTMTEPAKYGLDKPFVSILFGNGAHAALNKLGAPSVDGSRTLLLGRGEGNRLFASYQGETSVYGMLPEHIWLIPAVGVKWRDTHLFGFNPYTVSVLRQRLGTAPALELSRPAMTLAWAKATRAGTDVLKFVRLPVVEAALDRLSTFAAAAWMPEAAEVIEAMKKPSLELEMSLSLKSGQKDIKLTFAPSGPMGSTQVFFGKSSESPDYFSIGREAYLQLAEEWIQASP